MFKLVHRWIASVEEIPACLPLYSPSVIKCMILLLFECLGFSYNVTEEQKHSSSLEGKGAMEWNHSIRGVSILPCSSFSLISVIFPLKKVKEHKDTNNSPIPQPKASLACQLQRSHSVSACMFSSLWGLLFHQSDKQIKSHAQIKSFPVLQSHSVALLAGKHIVFDWCLGPLPGIFWCFCLWGTTTTCNEAGLLHPALLMCAF